MIWPWRVAGGGWRARAALALALGGAGGGLYYTHSATNADWAAKFTGASAGGSAAPQERKRLVVLGGGWGATALLRHIDPAKYQVSVVSPRNYFLMTPLLPGVTVGSVEARSCIASLRSLLPPAQPGSSSEFFEAAAVGIDPVRRTVRCTDTAEVKAANPSFELQYDYLVVAVGAPANTFGIRGVDDNAVFIKEVDHALRIRSRLMQAFETASLPGTTAQERKDMTRFIVVGGGPYGVEFAAQLQDFLDDDLDRLYPSLRGVPSIELYAFEDHILNSFDKRISDYAAAKFQRAHIKLRTDVEVVEVKRGAVVVKERGAGEATEVPCGLCVWSTGIGTHPVVAALKEHLGQPQGRALLTDAHLQVRGAGDGSILAMGDCADVKEGTPMVDFAAALFEEADVDKSGGIDLGELQSLLGKLGERFPHTSEVLKRNSVQELFLQMDADGNGVLDKEEFQRALADVDSLMAAHPATAQVAAQQGTYIAAMLNNASSPDQVAQAPKFQYKHLGKFITLGGEQAAMELPGDRALPPGLGTMFLWYAVYAAETITWRNRFLVAADWAKKWMFGRDPSRI